jgi:hypothetical protein
MLTKFFNSEVDSCGLSRFFCLNNVWQNYVLNVMCDSESPVSVWKGKFVRFSLLPWGYVYLSRRVTRVDIQRSARGLGPRAARYKQCLEYQLHRKKHCPWIATWTHIFKREKNVPTSTSCTFAVAPKILYYVTRLMPRSYLKYIYFWRLTSVFKKCCWLRHRVNAKIKMAELLL